MSGFSASDAAVEGFRVIGRHWRVVIGWAVFNLLALVAMVAVTVIVLLGVYAASGDAGGTQASTVVGGVIAGLGSIVTQAVITTALFRLMLRDEPPGFLYLRLGGDELRVLGAALLLVLAAIPLVLVISLAMVLASRAAPLLGVALGIVLIAAFYALALRFALAPVISFVERRISLMPAWRLTRGQTWRLIGMAILLLCIVAVIAVTTWIALFLLGGALSGFRDIGLSEADTLEAHPGRYVLQVVAEMLLVPVMLVIAQAPWVAAYKTLAAPAET
jgi:hypothetical protein